MGSKPQLPWFGKATSFQHPRNRSRTNFRLFARVGCVMRTGEAHKQQQDKTTQRRDDVISCNDKKKKKHIFTSRRSRGGARLHRKGQVNSPALSSSSRLVAYLANLLPLQGGEYFCTNTHIWPEGEK